MLLAVVFTLVSFAGNALADRIVLHNDDTMTGTVVKLHEGKLTLKTDYAGCVDINASKIKSVVTDNPVRVQTKSGEILEGKLIVCEPGRIVMEQSPDREKTGVDWEKVAAINPLEQGVWTGSVTVGGNLQSGNTDSTAISVSASAERRTDLDRYSLGFIFNYSEDEDELTDRNIYGNAKYDYFFSKKVYGYLGLDLLNDKFQDIRLRTIIGPGVGYQVWDSPSKSLALEAGVSYISDNMYDGEDDDYVTGRLGLNFRYSFFKFIVFTDRLVYYPSTERLSNYTLRNEAALATPLKAQWSLKFANIFQYDNKPGPGVGKTDSQWILGLQYQF